MRFEVTLIDATTERVEGADSFQQEGPLTTFFGTDGRRRTLDCWSTKVASFRTDRILKIRRLEGQPRDPAHEVGTFANTR
jgi:hypothetical protein